MPNNSSTSQAFTSAAVAKGRVQNTIRDEVNKYLKLGIGFSTINEELRRRLLQDTSDRDSEWLSIAFETLDILADYWQPGLMDDTCIEGVPPSEGETAGDQSTLSLAVFVPAKGGTMDDWDTDTTLDGPLPSAG